jgi:hypothetical protein
LRRLRPIRQDDDFEGFFSVNEGEAENYQPPGLRANYEETLLAHFRRLSVDDRATVLRVAQALDGVTE